MFTHTIELAGKKVKLMTNGMTAVHYMNLFNEDVLTFIFVDSKNGKANDADAMRIAQKLCFVMMKQAEGVDMRSLTIDDYYAWLETMSQIELFNKFWEVIAIFYENMNELSESKKKGEEPSAV